MIFGVVLEPFGKSPYPKYPYSQEGADVVLSYWVMEYDKIFSK